MDIEPKLLRIGAAPTIAAAVGHWDLTKAQRHLARFLLIYTRPNSAKERAHHNKAQDTMCAIFRARERVSRYGPLSPATRNRLVRDYGKLASRHVATTRDRKNMCGFQQTCRYLLQRYGDSRFELMSEYQMEANRRKCRKRLDELAVALD